MAHEQLKEYLDKVCQIAQGASELILEVYKSDDFAVEIKKDKSPLTRADKLANSYIVSKLDEKFSEPVLSEESPVEYEERKSWTSFWLVDPLDGTKDFINRTDTFTVNIALVEDQKPILGVVAVPAQKLIYYAAKDLGAWKLNYSSGESQRIENTNTDTELSAAISRFHTDAKTDAFLKHPQVNKAEKTGSALKFALVAEGKADIYPRLGPCCEWDSAAGHCLVLESGGEVLETTSGKPLLYNKESTLNKYFIALRKGLTLDMFQDYLPEEE